MAVSFRPEIKSDWSERTVFGRKFVVYDDRSSGGRRTLMGRPMCGGQPWDSRWPVMGQRPVLGRNIKVRSHCLCQNQFQYPLQFPCPSHRLHWIRIPVSFRLNFMSTTTSPDVKVWFCIGTCKIRMETDVRISFSRSGDRSKRNGR